MNTVDIKTIEYKLIEVLKNENPFSLLRLGDGEFQILKYPKYISKENFYDRFERWFDISDISYQELFNIRNSLNSSYLRANILGIPSPAEQRGYSKWVNFDKLMNEFSLLEDKIYFANYDICKLNFKRLLSYVKKIFIITCHDLRKQIKNTFNLKDVYLLQCPREKFNYHDKNWKNKNNTVNHYHEKFTSINKSIQENIERGSLYLVGAGGLGKIYCNTIKNCQGIALDIGSVFDAWAGIDSRPYLKSIAKL